MNAAGCDRRDLPQDADPRAPKQSNVDSLDNGKSMGKASVLAEAIAVTLFGPAAVILLVGVPSQGWQPWLLVIAGMLLAWAGDALWTITEHVITAMCARRAGDPR